MASDLVEIEDPDEVGQDVDVDALKNVEIEHFDKEVYYVEADETKAGYKNKYNLKLYLKRDARPTLDALVDTCIEDRTTPGVLFEQGMWVEYRSNDMRWKVGIVNRVIKQPPDDWDFDVEMRDPPPERMIISYNIGVEGVVSKDNIRAPELGLKFVFGKRPWLWQQFTLLQLERRVRFDENHEYDFEEIDNLKFATTRFEEWLNAEDNRDFKDLYDSQKEVTKELLRSHLITPFDLMDFIVEKPDEWDFDDPDISVYTYLAVLGSGVGMTLATLAIQILAPLLILYNAFLQSDGSPSQRFFVDQVTGKALNGEFFPGTDFDTFCQSNGHPGRFEGKILIALVLIVYICSVVPDSLLSFFRTSGGANSTYSKINSLRNIIWDQNDDDIQQQIGFKLDRIMNTGYLALIYMIMLFILLNTPIVLDVILNALAIDYIHQIDEKLANSDWWDEDNRWLKSGTIELVIQATLRLRILENGHSLCTEYGIDPKEYKDVVGSMAGLSDSALAKRDDKDPRYMTYKERRFEIVAQQAAAAHNDFVTDEFRKKVVQFGLNGQIAVWLGLRKKGMFHRYLSYRTWSRWHKVLFLPKLPDPRDQEVLLKSTRAAKVIIGQTDMREFMEHIVRVLSGYEMLDTARQSFRHGYYKQIPVKIFLGGFEILFYFLQIIFPFVCFACIIFVPYCY